MEHKFSKTGRRLSQAQGHTVLIADDSTFVVEFLSIFFQNAGFKVRTAHDGYEALEKVIKNDIDLIVTDINLPEMNGVTLLNSVKNNRSTKDVPVILISSNIPNKDESSRAYAFLQKPFSEESIIDIAEKAIKDFYGRQ